MVSENFKAQRESVCEIQKGKGIRDQFIGFVHHLGLEGRGLAYFPLPNRAANPLFLLADAIGSSISPYHTP